LLAALAASLVAAFTNAAGAEETTLTYAGYGGALQKAEETAWLSPYMAANPGVKIIYDNVDYAKLKAMVESGNVVWDVATVAGDFGLKSDEPLLEKIDCAVVPCADLQFDRFQSTGYRVPHQSSGVVLGYNTSKMPEGKTPQSWADFFDLQSFPGKRVVMMDLSSYVFEQALLGDGVDPKAMYPLDYDRAIAKLNSLGDSLIVAPSYQGCAELVGSGEAVMGGCWYGRFDDVKYRAHAPVEIQWNQAIVAPGYLVVPKGTKNRDAVMKLIAYITSAEHNADPPTTSPTARSTPTRSER
jgi:putative spermidine/putrescine transport system substrate-binding protein